jgi:hypothetical protein
MEQYPKINTLSSEEQRETLFIVKSLTYNAEFLFLPFNMKITENLTPEWNEQTVIGRMDPVSNFKRMGRTMTVTFQARANKEQMGVLEGKELLHVIDHLKKTLYPRYSNPTQIMVTPPLFRFRYGNLILAGENTIGRGVLGYITAFSANPVMDINKIYVDISNNRQTPFFPKVFDVSLTFTVLNERLAESQDNDILTERYFYNYDTDYHEHQETQIAGPQSSGQTSIEDAGKDQSNKASQDTITGTK